MRVDLFKRGFFSELLTQLASLIEEFSESLANAKSGAKAAEITNIQLRKPKHIARTAIPIIQNLIEQLETQQLLKSRPDLFSKTAAMRMRKQADKLIANCEAMLVPSGEELAEKNVDLPLLLGKLHKAIGYWLQKLRKIDDNIKSLEEHVKATHRDFLGSSAAKDVTQVTFEEWIDGRIRLVTESSGIWDKCVLESLN